VAFVDRTLGYTGYVAFTSVRIVIQETLYFLSHGSAACTYVYVASDFRESFDSLSMLRKLQFPKSYPVIYVTVFSTLLHTQICLRN